MCVYSFIYNSKIHKATRFVPTPWAGLMVATVQMNGTRIAHLQRQQKEGHLDGKLTSIHLTRGCRCCAGGVKKLGRHSGIQW